MSSHHRRLNTVAFLAIVLAAILFPLRGNATNDPSLKWRTMETPHFRISFYSGEEEVAKYLADLAESIHPRLVPALGWEPKEKTEIALTDQTDSANGITSGTPFNSIRLYLTAPDDMSPLGDVDDWYQELFTHEYTHTLHIDNMRGLPALLNALSGRTFIPNQVNPRWILEGLAVLEESERTSGGRLRSSQWNMYMRTDVLENNIAPLDVFSNGPRRWPQGNIWYLYGSFFLKWIADNYGEESLRVMAREYGENIIPFGVNRAIRRATKHTFEELYPRWVASMKAKYGAQADAIKKEGIREGVRLTKNGQTAQHPRWVPSGTFDGYNLLYFRDDGHSTAGHYGLTVKKSAKGYEVTNTELLVRTNGTSALSFASDGSVVFDSTDIYKNVFAYGDLFRLPKGETGASGLESARERLTTGVRAIDPTVSPDGKHVVFSTNHRGTSYLQIADLSATGVTNTRSLVRSEFTEQAYAPQYSPDGIHLAYSVWQRGGYRDIRYVDTRDGTFVDVTHDRAIDSGPAFSPDGKKLYFHSDRTGVSNIFAWNVETKETFQVTNTVTGAYQPSISPDGKAMAYIGYTHEGFDLFLAELDESKWTPALPMPDDGRPAAPPPPVHHEYPIHDYHPLDTLRPRAFSIQLAPGNFGERATLSAVGNDLAGHHSISGSMYVDFDRPEVQFDASYSYGRLPFDYSLRAYRTVNPAGGFQLGSAYKTAWISESVGVENSISFGKPGAFDGQNASITYGFARNAGNAIVPIDKYNPYDTPSVPQRGLVGTLSLNWGYSNVQRFLHSIGAEKGFSASTSVVFTHPLLASDYNGIAASANVSGYFLMPWLKHHSLGLHGGGGASTGSIPGRGPFYVGGFVDLPLVDTVRNILIQGGIVLRGYEPAYLIGRNFVLFNAEYRFPILNIDRGISTLPVFLNRVSGALFVDYGSAFNNFDDAKFKTGVGGELWFDTSLAYTIGFTFRLGYARGLASGGEDKLYVVAAVPF